MIVRRSAVPKIGGSRVVSSQKYPSVPFQPCKVAKIAWQKAYTFMKWPKTYSEEVCGSFMKSLILNSNRCGEYFCVEAIQVTALSH